MKLINKLNINQTIYQIDPYQPGKSNLSGKDKIVKLSSNENPLGCSKQVTKQISDFCKDLQLYPDGDAALLKQQIAITNNIAKENIICGCGSDEIINLIINGFCKEGDEIIYSEYGFLMYKLYALAAGVKPVAAKETNLKTDINNILQMVTDKTRIVFIANPNNPTGSYINADILTELRKKLPQNILLVIDGAYAEYVLEDDYESGFNLVAKYDNVIATRTFSKIYGLAALRCGYAYMHVDLIDILNRIRSPFNVNNIAQNAAIIALQDQDFVKYSQEHNQYYLQEFAKKFNNLGLKFYPTIANFMLVDLGSKQKAQNFSDFLNQQGIIVRLVAAYNLPNMARITIGNATENQILFDSLNKYFSK